MIAQDVWCYRNDSYTRVLWKSSSTGKWYISPKSGNYYAIGPKLEVRQNALLIETLDLIGTINGRSAWGTSGSLSLQLYYSYLRGKWIYGNTYVPEEFANSPGATNYATSRVWTPNVAGWTPDPYRQTVVSLDRSSKMSFYESATLENANWDYVTGTASPVPTIATTLVYPANWSSAFCGTYQSLAAGYTLGWRKFTGGPAGRTFQEIWNYHNSRRTLLSNDELYNVWWDSSVSKYVCSTKCGVKDLDQGYWEGGAAWAGLYTYFVNPPNPILPNFTLVFDSYADNAAFPLYTQKQAYGAEIPVIVPSSEYQTHWNDKLEKLFLFISRYGGTPVSGTAHQFLGTLRLYRENLLNGKLMAMRPPMFKRSHPSAWPAAYGMLEIIMYLAKSLFPTTHNSTSPIGNAEVVRESDIPAANNRQFLAKALKDNPGDSTKLYPHTGQYQLRDPARYSSYPDRLGSAIDDCKIGFKNYAWNILEKCELQKFAYYNAASAGGVLTHPLYGWGPVSAKGRRVNDDDTSTFTVVGTDTAYLFDRGLVSGMYAANAALAIPYGIAVPPGPGGDAIFYVSSSSNVEMTLNPGYAVMNTTSMDMKGVQPVVKNYYPFPFIVHVYAYRKVRYKRIRNYYPGGGVNDDYYDYNTDTTYTPPVLLGSVTVPAYTGQSLAGLGGFSITPPDLYSGPIPYSYPPYAGPFYYKRDIYEAWYCNWYIERIS